MLLKRQAKTIEIWNVIYYWHFPQVYTEIKFALRKIKMLTKFKKGNLHLKSVKAEVKVFLVI